MPTKVLYLETHSQNPFYNLAFEETILRERREGDYLILWQNERTIVVGQNQNTEAEINRSFVEANDIRVVRRMTGGGAVYHDLGNLNYSFITDIGNMESLTLERFVRPVVGALRGLGLQVETSGRNDILVEGRKVSGTAQRLMKNRILHHGTLLFDSDLSMMTGALQVCPAKFQSKSAKSVRSRVGNIREFLSNDMDITEFWQYLKTTLTGQGFTKIALADTELAEVETLRSEKYETWEWNFGCSPKFEFVNKRRFSGGSLEVGFHVETGIITQIAFYGDFLSVSSLHPLANALKGCPFRREAVEQVLGRFPIWEFFGTITAQEIMDTIFYSSHSD